MYATARHQHASDRAADRTPWGDPSVAAAKAACIAADLRAAELRAARKPAPQPRGLFARVGGMFVGGLR